MPPNVVLITLDTTRADHLGCYGYTGATSPSLDRFADTSVLYERAYASSSWTLPSHASLFTGLLPMQHGAQSVPGGPDQSLGYGVRPLAESFTTLAELLATAGYRSAAVIGGPALRRELGLAQGFDVYRDEFEAKGARFHGKRAEKVADQAIDLVQEFGSAPYFLFVNFFDPHAPYRPPPPFDRGLGRSRSPELLASLIERLEAGARPRPTGELAPEERAALEEFRAGYDAEIAYMDHHLGRLLQAVEGSPRAEDTLIVITGDHGESFGEHHFLSHGAHLYDDNVRVPLLIRYPGATGGRRIREPVQSHRVFASILAAAGPGLPEGLAIRGLEGRSESIVLQVQRSDSNIRLFGDFFARDLRAIHIPPYKLIVSSRGKAELFDLDRDPAELHDLIEGEPERARSLARELDELTVRHPPLFAEEDRATLRPETEEALRALGYLD